MTQTFRVLRIGLLVAGWAMIAPAAKAPEPRDLPETAELLGADQAGEDGLTVAYDKDWTRTEGADPAFTLVMHSIAGQEEGLREAELQVIDGDGEELLLWTVAAMEGMS